MLKPTYGLRSIFGTTRGARLFAINTMAAFGLVSAAVQFGGQLLPAAMPSSTTVVSTSIFLCLGWGLLRAYPRSRIEHELRNPAMTVTVRVGDLFEEDSDLVVGFSDTFDTSTNNNTVISKSSLQGQLLHRLYADDAVRLDREINTALARTAPLARESRTGKRKGKLLRYPLGTVAVLNRPGRKIFAVAYSRMGNDYVARSSVEDLWLSLDRLWDAVYSHGQRGRLAIPLMGAGLARVDALDRESLLKMTLLSFVARSRQGLFCRELRMVISPPDVEKINLLEVAAFLRTL